MSLILSAPEDQWSPAIAFGQPVPLGAAAHLGPGVFFIAYADSYPARIRGILINSAGRMLYPNVSVSVGGPWHRAAPDVAYNSTSGGFFAVWQQETSPGGTYDVFGLMVDGQGRPRAGPVKVAATAETETAPKVAYNPDDDEFLVVWEAGSAFQGSAEIWGRRLKGTGETEWPAFKITDFDVEQAAGVSKPAVSYGKGQYLVAWERQEEARIDGIRYPRYDVRARHVSSAGGVNAAAFCITCEPGTATRPINEMQPAIAYNPQSALWVVVFSMDAIKDLGGQRERDEDIARVLVNHHTVAYPQQGPVFLNTSRHGQPKHRRNPKVVYSGASDRFMVAWEEDAIMWGQPEIWSCYLDGLAATPKVFELTMNWIWYVHHVGAPALVVGDENILTVWEDGRNRVITGIDLYGWRSLP